MRPLLLQISAVALLLVVTGCNSENSLESQARSALALKLKDPASAQFTDLVENNGAICGFVNAKNSMGAYEGFSAFVVRNGTAVLDGGLEDTEFAGQFDKSCPPDLAVKHLQLQGEAHSARVKELTKDLNSAQD